MKFDWIIAISVVITIIIESIFHGLVFATIVQIIYYTQNQELSYINAFMAGSVFWMFIKGITCYYSNLYTTFKNHEKEKKNADRK